MSLRLRQNLHCCVCDGRVIFLDIEADRYFSLPPTAEEAFLRLAYREAEAQDIQKLESLLSRNLLVAGDGPGELPLSVDVPAATDDAFGESFQRARFGDVVRALAAEAEAVWRVKRRSFAKVIAWAARARSPVFRPGKPEAYLRRLVSASAAASYFIGATDRCLVRALALHSTCKRSGIGTQLVFGVRINPFGAHCWVQQGDLVLIGDFEQVRLFTPIKVVG